jgi:hypothetical protein
MGPKARERGMDREIKIETVTKWEVKREADMSTFHVERLSVSWEVSTKWKETIVPYSLPAGRARFQLPEWPLSQRDQKEEGKGIGEGGGGDWPNNIAMIV